MQGQNVACDPCKLRRIKCDLLNLLASLDGQAAPNEDEPAHLLVRRYPGQICTQCRNKGLQCSTEGILNPLKPNKGGKRIDEARQRFGGNIAVDNPASDYVMMEGDVSLPVNQGTPLMRGSEEIDWMSGAAYDGLLDQLGIPQSSSGVIGPSTMIPLDTGFTTNQGPSSESFALDPSDTLLRSLFENIDSFPSSTEIPLNGHSSVYPTPSTRAKPETQRQALEVWERLSTNTPQTIAYRSLRPSTSTSREESVDLDAHTPHPDTLVPALGRLDIETNTFLPIVPLDSHQPRAASGAKPGEAYGTHSGRAEMMRHGSDGAGHSSVSQNGKRQRSYDSARTSPSSSVLERLQPWERDPWHIWQAKDEDGSHAVAWSRKEQVQESLADKALGIELSRHLITVYFQAVHFSLPVRQTHRYTEILTAGPIPRIILQRMGILRTSSRPNESSPRGPLRSPRSLGI